MDTHNFVDRRQNADMRATVRRAIEIGERFGFTDAADYMFVARVPRLIAMRILTNVVPDKHNVTA